MGTIGRPNLINTAYLQGYTKSLHNTWTQNSQARVLIDGDDLPDGKKHAILTGLTIENYGDSDATVRITGSTQGSSASQNSNNQYDLVSPLWKDGVFREVKAGGNAARIPGHTKVVVLDKSTPLLLSSDYSITAFTENNMLRHLRCSIDSGNINNIAINAHYYTLDSA